MAARKQDLREGGEGGRHGRGSSGPDGAQERGDPADGRASRDRPLAGPGDDVGAADLGRRVAEHLRERRKARGMSLDDLARSSGVSRAALSQVETCKSNPTVGLLWKIAVGLGVPFADLIGERRTGATVLRRSDSQVLRSMDGKLESRPLSPAGSSRSSSSTSCASPRDRPTPPSHTRPGRGRSSWC